MKNGFGEGVKRYLEFRWTVGVNRSLNFAWFESRGNASRDFPGAI